MSDFSHPLFRDMFRGLADVYAEAEVHDRIMKEFWHSVANHSSLNEGLKWLEAHFEEMRAKKEMPPKAIDALEEWVEEDIRKAVNEVETGVKRKEREMMEGGR